MTLESVYHAVHIGHQLAGGDLMSLLR